MSEQFQLNADWVCTSTLQADTIQCFTCKFFFHAVCPEASDGETLTTKSLHTCYNRPSTKRNFQFFCNSCMTKLEISESNWLNILESTIWIKRFTHFSGTLPQWRNKTVQQKGNNGSIWFNQDRLASVKAPPSESMFVVETQIMIQLCLG